MSNEWQLAEEVESLDPKIIKYGIGFLNSRPQNWIPNFSSFWTPLLELLNFEVAVLDIQPTFDFPISGNSLWLGAFENNKIGVSCEPFVAKYLASLFITDIDSLTSKVLEDYLARRLMQSLVASWTGPSLSHFQYFGASSMKDFEPSAGIKITMSVNGRQVTLWLLIEELLLKKLDNLWRRQTTTFNIKKLESRRYQLVLYSQQIQLEELETSLVIGNKIYLAGLDPRFVTMRDIVNDSTWKIKLYSSSDQLVMKILESNVPYQLDVRDLLMRVTFPEITLSTEQLQLNTNESFISTGLAPGTELLIKVSDETVAQAKLGKDANGYFAQILN